MGRILVALWSSSVTLSWYCSKHGTGWHSLVLQSRNREVSGLNPWEFIVCAASAVFCRCVYAMSGYHELKPGHPDPVKVALVFTILNLFIWVGGRTDSSDFLTLTAVLFALCYCQYVGLSYGRLLSNPFPFIINPVATDGAYVNRNWQRSVINDGVKKELTSPHPVPALTNAGSDWDPCDGLQKVIVQREKKKRYQRFGIWTQV